MPEDHRRGARRPVPEDNVNSRAFDESCPYNEATLEERQSGPPLGYPEGKGRVAVVGQLWRGDEHPGRHHDALRPAIGRSGRRRPRRGVVAPLKGP